MSPQNPFFFIIVYFIAILSAFFIHRKIKPDIYVTRYETIDGLRGFLALGVFIHHSALWYQFIKTGVWNLVQSNIYNQFGGTSVSFFFMITSFLFVTKLLNSEKGQFNWLIFFKNRIFRLFPMYYAALIVIIIIVMIKSNWQIQSGWYPFLTQIKHWVWFSLVTIPDINNLKDTFLINAGVTWSLPYEWFFYFSLPLLALLMIKKPKLIYLIIGLAFIFIFYYKRGGYVETDYFFISFLGGAIAPFLIKYTNLKANIYTKLKSYLGSLIIIACLILICQFKYSMNIYCIVLSSIIFTIIALGNSLFGVLKKPQMRLLGDISYSTYLLHGIILYIAFNFVFSHEKLIHFTDIEYSFLIFSITPIVVLISYITYSYIEKPGMSIGKKLNDIV